MEKRLKSHPAASRLQLQAALSPHGLVLRGGFVPGLADAVPNLADGRPPAVLWLVGVVGSAFWPQFKASTFYQDGLPDPLDRWSAAIAHALAKAWGGRALLPSERIEGPQGQPSYHPFQRWASRAEPLQPSPLMLRMHPEHGPWHAYRFALALPSVVSQDLASATPIPVADICANCAGQPCLHTCPVQAFTGSAYRIDACASHLHSPLGQPCMAQGCLARRACPVAPELRYSAEHAAFHMRAFAGVHPQRP